MNKTTKLLVTLLFTAGAATAIFSKNSVAKDGNNLNVFYDEHETVHTSSVNQAYNSALGLQLIAGTDKPMVSLIDIKSNEVVATVGDTADDFPAGYGGSKATGEPFWFSEDKFALIDRGNSTIEMFQVTKKADENGGWVVTFLDIVETPCAVQRFVQSDISTSEGDVRSSYYALAEGAPDRGVAPAVLKYVLQGDTLVFAGQVDLAVADTEKDEYYRADFNPDGKRLYVSAAEGKAYVIDIKKMELIKTL